MASTRYDRGGLLPAGAASMRAADAEIDRVEHCRFRRALGEDAERFLRFPAIGPRALDGLLDGVMPAHQRQRLIQIALLDVAVLKRALPEGALLRAAVPVG